MTGSTIGDAACVTLGIVDNDPFALSMIEELLRRSGAPISVLWGVRSGPAALELCDRDVSRPQAVLTDMSMPDMDGVRLAGELRARHPGIAVVGMTAFQIAHTQTELTAAGIANVFSKGCPTNEMIRAIGQAAGNRTCSHWGGRHVADPAVPLTPAELEVIRLYANGRTTMAVARQLGRSEGTVKVHLRAAYRKIGVNCRAEAVRYCLERGLIQ